MTQDRDGKITGAIFLKSGGDGICCIWTPSCENSRKDRDDL